MFQPRSFFGFVSFFAASVLFAETAAATEIAQIAKGKNMPTNIRVEAPTIPSIAIAEGYMPAGYRKTAHRYITIDGEKGELTRYQREDHRNAALGGEHFSVVIAENGRLKGFSRIDLDLVGGELPSRDEARIIAMDFLAKAAPDLLPVLEVHWIEPHNEPLTVYRNGASETLTLTGMKVKMRNKQDGRWMWVIVGADRKVMVFERDIVWITFPGHRKTEKWLHDSWLAEKGY